MGLTTKKYFRRLLYLKIFLVITFAICIALAAIFWSFPTAPAEGYHNMQAMLRELQKVLLYRLLLCCAVTFLFTLPALVWILLFYSHRIAGPAHRIGQQALKIAEGDLAGVISFRRHDALTDMADSFNMLLAWYRNHLVEVNASLAAVDRQSESLCEALSKGEMDEASLKSAAAEITRNIAAMESSLQEIRT